MWRSAADCVCIAVILVCCVCLRETTGLWKRERGVRLTVKVFGRFSWNLVWRLYIRRPPVGPRTESGRHNVWYYAYLLHARSTSCSSKETWHWNAHLLACPAALPRRAEVAADGAEPHTSEGRGLPCLAEGSAGAAGWYACSLHATTVPLLLVLSDGCSLLREVRWSLSGGGPPYCRCVVLCHSDAVFLQ